MRTVGIHLNQDVRHADAPARSSVAEISSSGVLLHVSLCVTDAQIRDAVGADRALVVIDAPIAVPPDTRGRRDAEHVLAWLDIPAFPVTASRLDTVHGGARGVALAAALPFDTVLVEGIPDQVLRQLMWEEQHPVGSAALGIEAYRAAWLDVRPPAFRPRGGRARNDGLIPARALLAAAADLTAWPTWDRTGDLAALDEAAAIDAVACALTADRCLHGPADSWMRIGTPERGVFVVPAGPDLIDRAQINAARLRDEGTIGIPSEVAGGAVGPAHSW